MKLIELNENASPVIQLQLSYYHERGEFPSLYTEIKEFPSNKERPKWIGPHKNLDDIYWHDEQLDRNEGIRRMDLRYKLYGDVNSSKDDDERHQEAVKEFKQKTNKKGKFFFTEYEGVENDEWFLTFFPR